VFVNVKAAGLITIVSGPVVVCVGDPASVTFTVTVELPAVVGVPPTVHPVSVNPAGSVPAVMVQPYGDVPPVTPIVALYGTFTVPSGKVEVVNESGAGLMTMVSFLLAFCAGLPESVTVTVIDELPAAVGVPLTVHPVRIRPAGSVPTIEHVSGDVPPEAVIVAL
jgi:hypothetical protein